jgi:hypothetical protein
MAMPGRVRDPARPPPRLFNPVYAFAAIIVVLVVAIAGDKVYRWRHNRAPFGPNAVNAHVTGLQVLPTARHLHRYNIVGRLDIAARPAPVGSRYWLVVIDDRTRRLISMSGSPAAGDSAPGSGSAWDGSVSNFALKYPWLSPVQEVSTVDGYQDPGQTVVLPAGPSVALQFSGVDSATETTTPLTASALTVALLFDGPDDQTWWAKRLN